MKFKILAIMSVLLLSSTAALASDGFYMGLRGGVASHSMGDPNDKNVTKEDIDDNVVMAGFGLGYRFGYFRAELEYIWREETEVETQIVGIGTSKESFNTTSYMFNTYFDLSPYTLFTPYVMAGAGLSKIEAEYHPAGGANIEKYDESNFTWSVGGGLSAKVTKKFNIDVGYRYMDMGDVGEANLENHEIYGGLRYVF